MTNAMLRTLIGSNIRKERIACGLTIDDLSKLLDLTEGAVGLIERGMRGATPLTLLKLSDIFNRPIDHFFFREKADLPKSRLSQIDALLTDFTEPELDFVIDIIRLMRKTHHT